MEGSGEEIEEVEEYLNGEESGNERSILVIFKAKDKNTLREFAGLVS